MPEAMKGKWKDWIFGCDICQDVCPWNRFSKPHEEPAFQAKEAIMHFDEQEWLQLSAERFAELFRDSPIKRTGFEGIKRNIRFISEKR